jgi:hypothetical protein
LAKAEAEAEWARRRETEMLYRFSPSSNPVLFDQERSFDGQRTLDRLAEAEKRLAVLGFDVVMQDKVTSYIRAAEGFTIYADPRPEKKIKFHVFRDGNPAKGRRKPDREVASFALQDRLKHDLPRQFADLMGAALACRGPVR